MIVPIFLSFIPASNEPSGHARLPDGINNQFWGNHSDIGSIPLAGQESTGIRMVMVVPIPSLLSSVSPYPFP